MVEFGISGYCTPGKDKRTPRAEKGGEEWDSGNDRHGLKRTRLKSCYGRRILEHWTYHIGERLPYRPLERNDGEDALGKSVLRKRKRLKLRAEAEDVGGSSKNFIGIAGKNC